MRPAASVAAAVGAAVTGGAVAASFDFVQAQPGLPRFLGHGSYRLWLFLAALYGSSLAVVLLAAALLLGVLARSPVVAALWQRRPQPTAPSSPPTVAPLAVLLSSLAAAALFGGLLYPAALGALLRFHHRGLIALLVGLEASGLALLSGLVGLLLLSMWPAPTTDRGWRVAFAGPRSLYAVGWLLGLLGTAGGVALLLHRLLLRPQLTPPLRALNLALWSPAIALGALLLGHRVGRRLARWLPSGRRLDSRAALLLLPLALLGLPGLGLLLLYREPLATLNLLPIWSSLLALLTALLTVMALARPLGRGGRGGWLLLLVPPLFYLGALELGRVQAVRKSALALAPLCERLVLALTTFGDLDHDGVAGRWAIGGSDCDDLDPERHPGAFDWPDNGIDENCNGHDATALSPSPAPIAALPSSLAAQPNIVLITIDALRADHLSAYGYHRRTTPALDSLASDPDGLLFSSAWAHAPSTRYSVPAIMTGRYPSTIAWGPPHVHWPPEVLPENRLLSEMLAERGYSTTALLTYHYFEPSWGLGQGFADYDTHLMSLHSQGGDPAATRGSSARELSDLALGKLPSLSTAGKPYFLWLHYYDPHYRYEPHPPPPGEPLFGDRELDLYDGEIRYTDQQIGRLLDGLRQTAGWERTLVVVTADHGEGLGEHGLGPDRRHGYHLYANQTQVPLIVRIPGLRRAFPSLPKQLGTPVGHIEIAPTLLHLATGHDPRHDEPSLLGRSLLPLLADPKRGRDAVVFQEVMYEGPTVRKALVSERWHLIQNLIPDGTSELYDLQADPGEEHDLAGERPAIEGPLGARLAAWLDDSAVPPDFRARVAGNLSASPLSGALPIGGQLGDYLEVVAADVPLPQLLRSSRTEVAAVYHVKKRIPAGYRLFVHLRSSDGRSLNLDHDFLDGLVAPERLRPGLYVRDLTRIAIPAWFPPGPAALIVGLYRRDTRVEVDGPPAVADKVARAIRIATLDIH